MLILAIDTSTEIASAALIKNGTLLCEESVQGIKKHSEQIMPLIDSLLKNTGTDISDIDIFAVANGPGSFTGLRIGITTAKAFAYINDKPLVTVNTLDALALAGAKFVGKEKAIICPMIDARNNQAFSAIYIVDNSTGQCNQIIPERISDYTGRLLQEIFDDVNIAADANSITKKIFVGDATECGDLAKASSVGIIADMNFANGVTGTWASAEAFYLRESQAERLFKNK
jgi:tRNA threonylcarbamoyladenosine biosynthesis protein TsaB